MSKRNKNFQTSKKIASSINFQASKDSTPAKVDNLKKLYNLRPIGEEECKDDFEKKATPPVVDILGPSM